MNNPESLQNENNINLEMLYKRHYNLLLNYGLKYYPDEELVKDSIQDLFIKLYKREKRDTREYTPGYLLRALKNTISDNISHFSIHTEDILIDLGVDDNDLEKLFEKNDEDIQLSKKIIRIFRDLPKRQRMIIYLRYIRGLSYDEIKEIMDMNTQSAMNLISRALRSMRKHFQIFFTFFL